MATTKFDYMDKEILKKLIVKFATEFDTAKANTNYLRLGMILKAIDAVYASEEKNIKAKQNLKYVVNALGVDKDSIDILSKEKEDDPLLLKNGKIVNSYTLEDNEANDEY